MKYLQFNANNVGILSSFLNHLLYPYLNSIEILHKHIYISTIQIRQYNPMVMIIRPKYPSKFFHNGILLLYVSLYKYWKERIYLENNNQPMTIIGYIMNVTTDRSNSPVQFIL
jgi:hypothetical protein